MPNDKMVEVSPCRGDKDASLIEVQMPVTNLRDELPSVFEIPKLGDLDLFETSVDEIQHLYSTGQLDSTKFTAFCLENIRKVRRSV